MRVCAVALPELRVEVLRVEGCLAEGPLTAELHERPLGLVVAPLPVTEKTLLGQTRLDVASKGARALGVFAGQTIARARSFVPDLQVRVVRPEAVRRALERLAEIALSFGATVSFAEANAQVGSFGDVVWADITGCAHLHAQDLAEGEELLATRLASAIAASGHTCAIAVADGPRVAATLARELARGLVSGKIPAGRKSRHVLVVPQGKGASSLARLSIAALPLLAEDVRWLQQLGVRTIEELRALPRASLAARIGKHASAVLAIASGEDSSPLDAYVPPEIPEECVSFEVGVSGSEALVFVTKMLLDRMEARLAGRGMAASKVEIDLDLDDGLVARANDDELGVRGKKSIVVDLPSPLSSAKDLLAALRPRIERLDLPAPALAAKLRVPVLVHRAQVALSLFDPMPKASRVLPRLVAELSADLGDAAVGKLALGDAWMPEERSRFVKFEGKSGARTTRRLLSSVAEPTRILEVPIRVAKKELIIVRRLCRLEAVAWWKSAARTHDRAEFVQAWIEDALAWIEVDPRTNTALVRGWFD